MQTMSKQEPLLGIDPNDIELDGREADLSDLSDDEFKTILKAVV
jgi:hypothetical protein